MGHSTALGAVEECLSRIAEQDPAIQSFVALREDAAREEARELDATTSSRGPLHGIPFAVKDIFDTGSLPTEYNSELYRGHQPEEDAQVVALLRRAGAILLGKVSTVEFAGMGNLPTTRNPHHLAYSPGGSSSGSGAAVGAGMVPLAIGSQTGGSTIRPAAYCGAVGFKPTWDLVSCLGMKPFAPSLDTVGFIGDTSELMVRVLAAVRGLADPNGWPNCEDPPPSLRVGVYPTRYIAEASPCVIDALTKLSGQLTDAGHTVEDVVDPFAGNDINAIQDIVMWGEGLDSMRTELTERSDQLSAAVLSALRPHHKLAASTIADARAALARMRLQCDKAMSSYDVWLTPAVADVAPLLTEGNGEATFNRLFTALHVPCVTLPVSLGSNNLPLGLQLVAARGADQQLIQAAAVIERLINAGRAR